MIRRENRSVETSRDPVSLQTNELSGVRPIQAPDDYVSPFGQRNSQPSSLRGDDQPLQPPALPARSYDPSDMTSVSNRARVPVREAALVRPPSYKRQSYPQPTSLRSTPQPIKPDTSWVTIQP